MSPQVGENDTGVETKAQEALATQLFGKRYSHEAVGRLGLSISVPLIVVLAILMVKSVQSRNNMSSKQR